MTQAIRKKYVAPVAEATVYEPQNAGDAYTMAQRLVKSGLLPAGIPDRGRRSLSSSLASRLGAV